MLSSTQGGTGVFGVPLFVVLSFYSITNFLTHVNTLLAFFSFFLQKRKIIFNIFQIKSIFCTNSNYITFSEIPVCVEA